MTLRLPSRRRLFAVTGIVATAGAQQALFWASGDTNVFTSEFWSSQLLVGVLALPVWAHLVGGLRTGDPELGRCRMADGTGRCPGHVRPFADYCAAHDPYLVQPIDASSSRRRPPNTPILAVVAVLVVALVPVVFLRYLAAQLFWCLFVVLTIASKYVRRARSFVISAGIYTGLTDRSCAGGTGRLLTPRCTTQCCWPISLMWCPSPGRSALWLAKRSE